MPLLRVLPKPSLASSRWALAVLIALPLASGCAATQAGSPSDPVPQTASAPSQPETSLDAKLLYRILLSDIAGQRNRLDVAVRELLAAARDSRDPRVARRAMQAAAYAKDYAAGAQAARRWLVLEPDSATARREYAVLLLRSGDRNAAVQALAASMPDPADDAGAGFTKIAALLAREPDRAAALAALQDLAQRYPDAPEAHLTVARLAAAQDESQQALASAERAYALDPDSVTTRSLLAELLVDQGQLERALTLMAAVADSAPEDYRARMGYARLLLQADRHDAARAQFRRIREQAPDEPDPLYALALLAMEADQPDEAEPYFRRLLELGARRNEAAYYLGVIEQERERLPEALAWYAQVRKGDLRHEAALRMAQIRMERGDIDAARTQLRTLRTQDPNLASRVYLFEAELLERQQQPEQALALYDEALNLRPDDADLLYARGLLGERLDRIDILERDLRRILEQDPDNAHALNALGFTYAERGQRLNEAETLIRRALEQEPDDPAILDSMGWVAYRLGRLEEAEGYLRQALDKQFDGEIAAHLGEVLWMLNRKDEARAVWKRGREQDPEDTVLTKTLERFDP